MLLCFKTRSLARAFASRTGGCKVIDLGTAAAKGSRWAVKVTI